MGLVHISEEKRKAVVDLDNVELQRVASILHSVVSKLGDDSPVELARLWSLAAKCHKPTLTVNVVTPSAAALKQRLAIQRQNLEPNLSIAPALQPIPAPPPPPSASSSLFFTTTTNSATDAPSPSPPLAVASRGFGQSLEEAFAGLGRLKDPEKENQNAVSPVLEAPQVGGGLQENEPKLEGSCFGACKLRRLSVEMSPWKGCLATPSSEHNNSAISALLYCPVLEAFSGDWEQKGWLFSASHNLLNLWVCSRKPVGHPLELMHSQNTATVVDAMDVDMGVKVIMSVGSPRPGRPFRVALHSLQTKNLFEPLGTIQIPERTSPEFLKQIYAGSSRMVHVSSLQPFKGPLKTALAVGLGGDVLVYELAAASTVEAIVAPRASWRAHDTAISCMHPSAFCCSIITGACDGSIKLWDLRSKPTLPSRQCGHQKQVTGLAVLDTTTLCSSGTDGSIHFWDLRSTNRAFASVIPDGKPVLNMASASSSPSLIAFTTRQSLYCLEFCGPEGMTTMLSPLRPLPPVGPCTAVKWNTNSKHVYAAGVDGTISVFKNASSSS
ncbi:hypothetical protein SELMODRAFT_419453 [Selaginella moellendorffii]|uniref:Uncharacterized protein n=1 Tax=Selaginella moellendorffii TaxID=88036 RepID=D8S904_SELML|nr:uncharacterized protein LOC9636171 [Selaginella moellendorffii]EFJ19121.1 hypothetical protein SELMODRAFT_419453 [Selaginella moellendorffii]|eukprot:XP_002979719.1 uncharacterized protein LOC9636171 [Selaginella moellendorffii]